MLQLPTAPVASLQMMLQVRTTCLTCDHLASGSEASAATGLHLVHDDKVKEAIKGNSVAD